MAVVVGLIGGVISGIGAYAQAQSAAKAADYQAAVAKRNESIALNQGYSEFEDARAENRKRLASMRVAYGASGIDIAGSPLDVIEDQSAEMEYDAQKIKYSSKLRSMGYADEAKMATYTAKNARASAPLSAAGAFLSTAGSSLSSAYSSMATA